ncbi:MAG TPA: hypothetical protein VFZ34_24920, partial [Blastocatellia bacterium]|nr:hypothetical protein [Blastocatellia bacterium]
MDNTRYGAATKQVALEQDAPSADVREAVINQHWQQRHTPWYVLQDTDQATQLLRFIPQMLLRYTCYFLGLSLLLMLGGALLREQFSWFDNLLNTILGKQTPLGYLTICFQGLVLYGQIYLGCLMYKKWKQHVRKRDLTNHSGVRFFWDEASKKALEQQIPDPATRAAVWKQKQGVFFTKGEGWKPLPLGGEIDALMRGYNTVGMSLAAFVWKELTVGMLYPATALKRILLNRWGFQVGTRTVNRHEMY